MEFFLPDTEVIEEPPCADLLSGGGLYHLEVLSNLDIIPSSQGIEPSSPFLSDELSVGHKAINIVHAEKPHEAFHNLLPLLLIGVASLGHQLEYQRECNSRCSYAEHEDVDVEFPELPVGPVHVENHVNLYRTERKNHSGYYVEIKGIPGKEPLQTSEIGVLLNGSELCRCQFIKTDSLHHNQCVEERHEFYPRLIHCFSKILLHNREDWANFDQVLGIGSFHGEKSGTFPLNY